MRNFVVFPAIVALAAVVPLAQPAQNPTFRSGADVVRIDVSVLDKNRVPVQGLTAADFIVREEGKPRPVVAVGEVVLPPAPAPPASVRTGQEDWTSEIAPDIGTNQMDQARLFVIVGRGPADAFGSRGGRLHVECRRRAGVHVRPAASPCCH